MWKEKLILAEGDTLEQKSSKTTGFMGETDVTTYSIVGADGTEKGSVRLEDHTAVNGFNWLTKPCRSGI